LQLQTSGGWRKYLCIHAYTDLPFKNVGGGLDKSSAVLWKNYKGVLLNDGAVQLVNGCAQIDSLFGRYLCVQGCVCVCLYVCA